VTGFLDLAEADAWVRSAVVPTGPMELERERAWATVCRVPTADGLAWFKACRQIQAFEPALTAALATRWPDRVARVLAHDPERAWLLTADAGDEVGKHGNAPEIWLRALPRYAELQRGEIEHAAEHLERGVPDMRIKTLPARFEQLVSADLPIEPAELERFRRFAARFRGLCEELAAAHDVASIQHDDLHLRSLFVDGPHLRVLDWGDASIADPFASLVVTFRFLEDVNGLPPGDPWFVRLRDAYLEPWGRGLNDTFDLAMRVGMVAQMVAWQSHRAAMSAEYRAAFDVHFAEQLRRVLARAVEPGS
jgi:hypothetical protein